MHQGHVRKRERWRVELAVSLSQILFLFPSLASGSQGLPDLSPSSLANQESPRRDRDEHVVLVRVTLVFSRSCSRRWCVCLVRFVTGDFD